MDWIPTALVGVGGSFAAWLLTWWNTIGKNEVANEKELQRLQERDGDLRTAFDQLREGFHRGLEDMREEFRIGLSEMRQTATDIVKLQSSQSVVNQVTAKAIEGIMDKVDAHDRMIADHSATLRLVNQIITMKDRAGQ